MSVRVRLLVALTCLVAAVGYLGAVTPRALLVYVLPASLFGSLAAASARPGRLGSALLTVVVVAGGWAVVVNALSGTTQGPAARSSAPAALLSGLAVLAVQTRLPAAFLLPAAGVLVGALALGAGGEIRPIAVAAVAPAALALRAVDAEGRRWLLPPRDRVVPALGLLLALVGAAVALQLPVTRTPLVVFSAQADPAVSAGLPDLVARPAERPSPRPTPASALPTTRASATATPSRPASTATVLPAPLTAAAPPDRVTQRHRLRNGLLVLLALALLLLLALLVRLLLVRLAWRRLRRAYHRGDARTGTAGAWLWVRSRLEGLHAPLPPGLSPDSFDATTPPAGVPATALPGLATLAPLAAQAGFNPSGPTEEDRALAWQYADDLLAHVERAAPRRARVRVRLRSPVRH